MELFALTVGLSGAAAWLGWNVHRHRQWRLALGLAAEALALPYLPGSWLSPPVIDGTVGGVRVRVDSVPGSGRNKAPNTRIRCEGGQPPGLVLRPEGLTDTVARAFGAAERPLGDPAFDRVAVWNGEPEERLRARTDAATRSVLTRAVARGARLEDDTWTLLLDELVTDADRLVALVRIVLDAALALAAEPPPDRLATIARTDPLVEIRRSALESLLARDGAGDWLVPFARDPDGRVAALAAGALGARGRPVLVELLARPRPDVVRAAALALARLAPADDPSVVERALHACLGEGDIEIIDALGRIGTVASVPVLAPFGAGALGLRPSAWHAQRAVRAIQARLHGAEHGTLALAETVGGGLAVADDPHRVPR